MLFLYKSTQVKEGPEPVYTHMDARTHTQSWSHIFGSTTLERKHQLDQAKWSIKIIKFTKLYKGTKEKNLGPFQLNEILPKKHQISSEMPAHWF